MLRLVDVPGPFEKHDGEIYCCSYSPDGTHLLSGGWDGKLRLWDTSCGNTLSSLSASPKPLSSCAYSTDAKQWVSGSMEGLVSVWDAVSHQIVATFMAHTRPVSGIDFSPDGKLLATASWDRQVAVRMADSLRDSRTIGTHHDIVSGCRFGPDGALLFSWSHDSTIKVWDVSAGREAATFAGHTDRVTTLALSPDGRMALSGSRDATVRLWDLEQMGELATVNIGAEVRACFFLLDGESVIVTDSVGRLFLMSAPAFRMKAQIQTPFRALSGALSPTGLQIALGGEDGIVHFFDIEGQEETSFVVTATQSLKEEPTMLGRLFGGTRMTRKYNYTCPACRQPVEAAALPPGPVPCPRCHRQLRIRQRAVVMA
jgi:WD40 repeat protein